MMLDNREFPVVVPINALHVPKEVFVPLPGNAASTADGAVLI